MKLSTIAFATLTCLIPLTSSAALDCDVKPTVTSMKAPTTYMLVGNSYTYYSSGVSNVINGLANAAGLPIESYRMITSAGADLSWWDVWGLIRPSGMAALYPDKNGKLQRFDFRTRPVFDAVVLQDNSMGPITPGRAEDFQKYAKQHSYDLQCANIQPLLMMTWARKNKPEMTKQLANAITKAGNEAQAMVIPVGLAFAEAIKKDPKLELYRADKSHPSPEGTYLEGCVIFATMYHRSPVGLNYYGEEKVDEKTAKFLQSVAWDTTKEFFGWTK